MIPAMENPVASPGRVSGNLRNKMKSLIHKMLEMRIRKTKRSQRSVPTTSPSPSDSSLSPWPSLPEPPPDSVVVSRHLDEKLTQVWDALKNEDVQFVGIVGAGGIGKTTLLKEIHQKSKQDLSHDFDKVIWVFVSKKPNIQSIQEQLLSELGFPIDASRNIGLDERRRAIHTILSTTNFLLLLDDVWQPFDFSEVGVPTAPAPAPAPAPMMNQQNHKCKVVYTTRFKSITANLYHGLADSKQQKLVEVNALSRKEGYELLVENIGEATLLTHPDLPQLAQRIADLCGGLPLAIVIVGRALAGEEYDAWESLTQKLESLFPESTPVSSILFDILKLFYDSLDDEDMRYCFRYFSLFQEDHVLSCDQHIDYWIGEGFLNINKDSSSTSNDKISDARNLGYSIVRKLKTLSLLLGDESHIWMHDAVRDFALQIGDKYLVLAGERLTEAPPSAEWKEPNKISLMNNQIEQLSEAPECPNLSTLILSKNPLKKIGHGFFQFMTSLRVLDLSWSKLGEIPEDIVSLISLQYLNLSHTDISRLPNGFINLVNLRVLDLSYMSELFAIPQEVLLSLGRLEVWNSFHSGPPRDLIVEGTELQVGRREFVEKLQTSLTRLDRVGITIKDVHALEKLEEFHKMGVLIHSLLILSCEGLTTLRSSSLSMMNQLNTFEVNDCEDLELIEFSHWIAEGSIFHNLRQVKIERCWSLKELTWLFLAPNLQELCIDSCMNLEVVIGDHLKLKCSDLPKFVKLKIMCFTTLPVLTCVSRTAVSFPSLEEITVSYSPELKKFPIKSKSDAKHLKSIRGHRKWWDDLEWEDLSFKNSFLECFEEIKS